MKAKKKMNRIQKATGCYRKVSIKVSMKLSFSFRIISNPIMTALINGENVLTCSDIFAKAGVLFTEACKFIAGTPTVAVDICVTVYLLRMLFSK